MSGVNAMFADAIRDRSLSDTDSGTATGWQQGETGFSVDG